MNFKDARILVASDGHTNSELVSKLLLEEFELVYLSWDESRIAADFEKYRPQVLVLAFETLELAERYYLGLFRQSQIVHTMPHRTLLLCNKEDVRRAYELCRKEYFDDYVLFWPMVHDTRRLCMSVLLALRALSSITQAPKVAEIAAHVRQVGDLEGVLDRSMAEGAARIETTDRSLRMASEELGEVIEGFADLLAGDLPGSVPAAADVTAVDAAQARRAKAAPRLTEVENAMTPLREWLDGVKIAVAPPLASARNLQSLAADHRPLVLVVDDDEFQCKLLARLLDTERYELLFAHSATEALAALRRCRPSLILMDVMLPDMDGVEVTRRLKASSLYASVPVVMITGQSERNTVQASLQAGAIDFVVKPFDRERLRAKVSHYLQLD